MKKIKHVWRRDGAGVSGAVTAVMLLLIITSVVSIVMTFFVPIWGEADESQHMRQALEQFYAMRENVDAQILQPSPIMASSKITLGNEPNALLGMYRTAGRLAANPFNGSLSVYNTTDQTDLFALSRGNVTFTSQNAYIPQRSYIFEQGAVLVANPRGEAAMRVPPHFAASKDATGDLSLKMLFVSVGGDFSSFAGTENVIVESNLLTRDENVYEGAEWELGRDISINLTTPYIGAWASYFNETLTEPLTNLTAGADFNMTTGAGWVRLDLNNVKRMDLGIAVVEMKIK
jgi:hypothetical protein